MGKRGPSPQNPGGPLKFVGGAKFTKDEIGRISNQSSKCKLTQSQLIRAATLRFLEEIKDKDPEMIRLEVERSISAIED